MQDHEMKNEGKEKAEKGIIVIQKYFRGYQARFHCHKLKDGIITLQSFARGENARRKFQNLTKNLTQTTHIHQDFVWKPLRTREATIIYLQSVVRSWLSRKHIDYIEDPIIENNNEVNDIRKEIVENKDQVKVSQSYIRDLEQQYLRVETALQHKKHENYILELQIQQIDKKWELHKAKMDMKEKAWQDEFTSIQMSIASTEEETTNEINCVPQKPTRQENVNKNITIRQILERQESGFGFQMENKLNSRKGQEQELRKLKGRFKAWKKEFKTRLHNVKRTLDRLDHCRTQKVHKSCFVS
uniref:myosin-4-like n=1 Tax=Erigeron canadensis TaxID=72917 RepID=UPI001CB9CFE7|nr:myosin-4-like [Erigeron canadensis]